MFKINGSEEEEVSFQIPVQNNRWWSDKDYNKGKIKPRLITETIKNEVTIIKIKFVPPHMRESKKTIYRGGLDGLNVELFSHVNG